MRPTASPLAVWAGIIVLYLVWGSTYLGIKVAIETIPPFLMSGFRFVPAGLILATAVALRARATNHRPTAVEVRDSAIVGGCLLVGGMGLVSWSEQTVPSGVAALLIGLMPMWLALFARIGFGDRLPAMAVVGTAVGLAGVALLAWPAGGPGQVDPAGLLVLLVSPMLWATGTLYAAKRAVLPAPALFATGLEMLIGGVFLLGIAFATGEATGFDVASVSPTSWLGLLYLIGIGSLVGYTTYAWLLTVAPLPRVATYAYVNPVIAMILGWIVLGEPLTPRTIAAAIIIVVGVVLIVTARGRAAGSLDVATHTEVRVPAGSPANEPGRRR